MRLFSVILVLLCVSVVDAAVLRGGGCAGGQCGLQASTTVTVPVTAVVVPKCSDGRCTYSEAEAVALSKADAGVGEPGERGGRLKTIIDKIKNLFPHRRR